MTSAGTVTELQFATLAISVLKVPSYALGTRREESYMPRHRSLGAFWGGLCSAVVVCVGAIAFGCPTEAGAQAQLTYHAAIAVSVSSASDPHIH